MRVQLSIQLGLLEDPARKPVPDQRQHRRGQCCAHQGGLQHAATLEHPAFVRQFLTLPRQLCLQLRDFRPGRLDRAFGDGRPATRSALPVLFLLHVCSLSRAVPTITLNYPLDAATRAWSRHDVRAQQLLNT